MGSNPAVAEAQGVQLLLRAVERQVDPDPSESLMAPKWSQVRPIFAKKIPAVVRFTSSTSLNSSQSVLFPYLRFYIKAFEDEQTPCPAFLPSLGKWRGRVNPPTAVFIWRLVTTMEDPPVDRGEKLTWALVELFCCS